MAGYRYELAGGPARPRGARASIALAALIALVAALVAPGAPAADAATRVGGEIVLYEFGEGGGSTIADTSGVGDPLDLTIADPADVTWGPGGLTFDSPTVAQSAGAATKVATAVAASNAVSVELWVEPTNTTQDGPARILSISSGSLERNLTVGQGRWGSQPSTVFDTRLRTTSTSVNGKPALTTPTGSATTDLTHLVFTRTAAGVTTTYVDGVVAAVGAADGSLSNWSTTMPLLLGNELGSSRPWLGRYCLAAIYDGALTAQQVEQNTQAGCDTVNTPPTAIDDEAQVVQGESVTIDVVDNDTDDDGTVDPASIQIEAPASQGTAVVDGTQVTYTSTGATGVDSFSYSVADEDGDRSDPATVTVTVRAANIPPVVTDPGDQAHDEGDLVSLAVEATDGNGDVLTFAAVGLPAGLSIDESTGVVAGALTQTSAGTFPVTVTVDDGFGGQDSVEFDWVVAAVNVAPVLDPIADQQDPTGDVSLAAGAVDPDGDPVTYGATGLPPGVGIDATTGAMTGSADTPGDYTVTVTVTDPADAEDTTTFTWSIVDVVIQPVVEYEFDAGAGSVVADTSGVGTPLDLTIDAPGNTTWLPSGLEIETATTIASSGAASKVTDAVAASGELTVDLYVRPTFTEQDGPARILSISSGSTTRDLTVGHGRWGSQPRTTYDVRLRSTATDLNGRPSLTSPTGTVTGDLQHVVYTRAADGATTLTVDGTVVASGSAAGSLENWSTSMPLLLGSEVDGSRPWIGAYCYAAVYAEVVPLADLALRQDGCDLADDNAAPVLDTIADQTSDRGEVVTLQATASDPDGDAVTFSGTGFPPGLDIDADGLVSGVVDEGAGGDYDVTVTASDPAGASDSTSFTWSVVVPNTPPTAVDDEAQVVAGESVTIDVVDNDSDDDGTVDGASIQIASDPAQGTAVVDGSQVVYTSNGTTGQDTFTYSVADDDGDRSDPATVTVEVRAANVAPDVTDPGDQTNDEGDLVSLQVVATDDNGDALTFEAAGLPAGLSIDESTGLVSGALTQTSAGTYPVTVTVDDGFGGQDGVEFDWVVAAVNVAPVLDSIADQQDRTGDTVSVVAAAEDVDGDVVEYAAVGLPDGLTIDAASGEIAGTIAAAAGVYPVTVTATDTTAEFDETSFSWTVLEGEPRAEGAIALYEFEEGTGSTVADTSGVGTPLDLTIADAGSVTWTPGALTLDAPTTLSSGGDATKIIDAAVASDEVTVEAWITPANTTQDGPARILSISESAFARDLTLGQGTYGSAPTDTFDLRLRTTDTTSNGRPSTTTPTGVVATDLTHVAATRAADGTVVLYVDGVAVETSTVGGTLDDWDPMPLLLGNEADGNRPWLGSYCLAAVYDRALTPGEVTQNFDAGCALPSEPSGVVTVLDGSDDIEGSTFNAGSFLIENTSTTGTTLTSFSLDLSTALYHDVVFDPDGDAGDAGSKCFTPDAGDATTVGLQQPAGGTPGTCDNSMLSGPNAGGYDTITLTFDDFDTTEGFGFSIDNDPTSIQGVPITGNSGAISGFELVGSTVTLTFEEPDGSPTTLTGQLFVQDGTDANGVNDGAAELVLSVAQAPVGPVTIDVVGAGLADLGYPNGASGAVVTSASQQVAVTGPAGADVRLVVVESSFDEPVGFDKDPLEANKAEVITTYDVTLDGAGTALVDVALPDVVDTFDDNNGDLYHLVAGVAAGGAYPSTSNLVYLELDPTAGPASPVIDPIADQVVGVDDALELPVTATDANGDEVTLSLSSTPDITTLGATFDQPVAGVGDATLSWTPTLADVGTYEVTITASDPTAEPDSQETFTLTVTDEASGGSALVAINPGSTGIDASTFGNGSFAITNASTGGQTITAVSFDLSTAWLADVVFDPVGTAGDATAKCLTPNSGAAATGFVTPSDPCVDPFSQPHDGVGTAEGYDVLSTSFTDFGASETFTFSVDVDPTSIKDVSGAGNAGSISGFELTGSTVTVTFDDGTVVAEPFRTGTSNGGSSVVADATPRDTVTLDVDGVTLAPQPQLSVAHSAAAVVAPSQTVLVTGPPNADVRLLRVEAARVQTPSYDPDPFEANKAIQIEAYDVTLDAAGEGQVEVTLTDTATGTVATDVTGLNHFMAVIGESESTGPLSNVVVLDLTDGPTAVDDTASTVPAGQIEIDVLDNDTSAIPLDPASVTVTSGPTGGTVLAPDPTTGAITYNAEQGFDDADGDSFTYTVADTDGNVSDEATVTIVDETATGVLYRVNAGGAELAATDGGPVWTEDQAVTDANGTAATGTPSPFVNADEVDITYGQSRTMTPAGDAPAALFQTERYDNLAAAPPMTWAFPVTEGASYEVRLYLAEIFTGLDTTTGRIFDVDVEGTVPATFSGLDPYALGGNAFDVGSVVSAFVTEDGTDADSDLVLTFLHDVENPAVKGIEVVALDGGTNIPPSVTDPGDQSFEEGATVDLPIEASDDPAQTLTYDATGLPAGLSIDATTGVISGTITDPADDYPVVVTVTDDGDPALASTVGFTIAVTGPPLAGEVLYRVNAGGSLVAATDGGPDWTTDTPTNNSTWLANAGSNNSSNHGVVGTVDASVPASTPDAVFTTERWDNSNDAAGEMAWAFPVDVGTTVAVRLHLRNGFGGTDQPGERVFDVVLEGTTVLDDYDIVADVGHDTATMKSFEVTSDGTIDIEFLHVVENPLVNAIEVVVAGPQPGVLTASPGLLDLGLIENDTTTTETVTLTNLGEPGDQDIIVSDVAADGLFSATLTGDALVPPGGTTTVDVTYAPDATGQDTGTLTVTHDGVDSPTTAALSGESFDPSAVPVGFSSSGLVGEQSNNPTSLEFGPDDRLYVAQQDGTIYAYTIVRNGPDDYSANDVEQIDDIKQITNHDDDGSVNAGVTNRQVTGLVTAGTAANPVLYVSSSDPRIGAGGGGNDTGLDTNSGVISRLTWTGTDWERVDLVRGLPRSEENHSTNGLDIDPATNTLYVMSGGHANKGAPSNNFAGTTEYYLSAAMLSVDLDDLEARDVLTDAQGNDYVYDLPTLDDPTRDDSTSDPFGGNNGLNQAVPEPGGPVQIHSPGYRNAYDVVLTSTGRLYTSDNGPNGGWGGLPLIYDSGDNLKGHELQAGVDFDAAAGDYCTNEFNEDGSNGHGDPLHHVSGEGYYGGHPTPIRAFPDKAGVLVYEDSGTSWDLTGEYGFGDLLPTGLTLADFPGNPVECSYSSNDSSKYLAIVNSSTNGIAEYTASNFGGAMQGDLLTASFNGNINRYELNSAGDDVVASEQIFSGFGSTPLDVTTQGDAGPFPGTVWAATYGADTITVFEPDDYDGGGGPVCTGADDPTLDEDGDGFDNADEIAAGTDPCNGGSQPTDFDGDGTSDVTDTDDDGDGVLDTVDAFARDPDNGLTTTLPVLRPFDGAGVFDLGFTGLMTNGTDTWLDQFDEANLDAGGATEKLSVNEVSAGDAYQGVNTQENAFQYGIAVDQSTPPFVVHTQVEAPFFTIGGNTETPVNFESNGVFLGTGSQDDYLKLVFGGNGGPGTQVLLETGGTATGTVYDTTVTGDFLAATAVDLYLTVDPAAATVQPAISLDGGATVTDLGAPVAIPAAWLDGADDQGLAVGIISTSTGTTAEPFTATWDFLDVTPVTGFAPTISATSDVTVEEGAADSVVLGIADADGDALTVDVTSTPDASGFVAEDLVENAPGDYSLTLDLTPQTGDVGIYDVTVSADDGANPATTETFQVTVTEPTDVLFRVNAGGPQVAAADGSSPVWGADTAAAPSPYRTAGGPNTFAASSASAHPGAIDMTDPSLPPSVPVEVFEVERWDPAAAPEMLWQFPVADGTEVEVRLYFAELFSGVTAAGQRVFDVSVEGVVPTAFDDIDQFAVAGAKGAFMLTATTTVSGPMLDVEFLHDVIENPALKGIEVIEVTGSANADPVIDPIADQTVEEGTSEVVTVTASDDDGDPVTLAAVGLPAGASFDPGTGELTLSPDVGTAAGSPYVVEITADDGNGGSDAVSFTVTVTAPAPAPDPVVVEAWTYGEALHRVNAGGPEVVAADGGVPWGEDQVAAGNGGTAGTGTQSLLLDAAYAAQADGEKKAYGTGDPITLDASVPSGVPAGLFQVERWDPGSGLELGYDLPVPAGDVVEVRVYLAEIFQTGTPGTPREFDIQIDGATVAAGVTPLADYGHDVGFMLPFVVESDGTVDLDFIHVADNPAVKAIEVVPLVATGSAQDGDDVGLVSLITNPDTNSQDATLSQIGLSVDGGAANDIGSACTPVPGSALAPGDVVTCRVSTTVTGAVDDVVSHEVQVAGSFSGGDTIDGSSAPVAITIVEPPLAAPQGLSADAGVGVVQLSWDDDTTVDGWNVYRGTSAGVTPATGTLITTAPVAAPLLVDDTVTDGTTYHYVVTAVVGSQESDASGEASATPDTVRINAGGPTVAALDDGPDWASDDPAHPFLAVASGSSLGGFDVQDRDASLPTYVPQDVFQTERWDGSNGTAPDDLTYAILVAPGSTVTVNLLMANGWSGTDQPGARQFDVYLEGDLVLDEFDLTATYGHATGGLETFEVTDTDSDGAVEIVLEHGSGPQNPLVNAIEVTP